MYWHNTVPHFFQCYDLRNSISPIYSLSEHTDTITGTKYYSHTTLQIIIIIIMIL